MHSRDRYIASPQASVGLEMHQFVAELYPICRSITGEGFRETLRRIQGHIPLSIHEVPSGMQVFDWTVPKEWNIRDAYIKDSKGNKIVDFRRSNLHVVGYSIPVNKTLPLKELKEHLHTLPDHPDWIPYRTSYYKENWGFCLSHKQLVELEEGEFEVVIDASLTDGHLAYGECYLKGQSDEEILISCHACHPSLCNDNLSGVAVATFLAKALRDQPLQYSCRFLFIPATIGAITWLALHQSEVRKIKHGMVLTGVGDPGSVTYKKSRRGNAEVDNAFMHVLKHSEHDHRIIGFFPYGYDERQYCSPGFNLPVGCFMRTPHGEYPEYHTSADNLDFIKPESLGESFSYCLEALTLLQTNATFVNQNPFGEPQLGKRGLYCSVGGHAADKSLELVLLWVLNLSDGSRTLLDIAESSGLPYKAIRAAADLLVQHRLLKKVS